MKQISEMMWMNIKARCLGLCYLPAKWVGKNCYCEYLEIIAQWIPKYSQLDITVPVCLFGPSVLVD